MNPNDLQNIINDLNAPIKSFRIFALEELIKNGDSPDLIPVLQKMSETETDQECLMLVNHAITAVKNRTSGTHADVKTANDADFVVSWENADDATQMLMLSELPPRLPKELRTKGPELLATSKSHVVQARVIRLFCRSWPNEKFDLIAKSVTSESLALKLAAIRTLVHINPEMLFDDLPALLGSEDPQIKALAIRALTKIDKEEALNHLQALLLSPSESDRLAGIQNCTFLPFDMVKPVMLKYFAAENNAELLVRAGWILEMNPDVKVPFYLFEIAERSNEKKAALVKNILNEAVKLLNKSGILGNGFAKYTADLQAWVTKRNALRFAKQLIAKLDTRTIAPELDVKILAAMHQQPILDAFKEALNWPISQNVKKHVENYINKASAQTFETSAPKPATAITPDKISLSELLQKGENDILSELSSIEEKVAVNSSKDLIGVILAKETSYDVKIAVLNVMTKFNIRGFEDRALKQISNPNVPFATAAVEYLGKTDPERIFPYLGQCLKVADVQMKSAALGIMKNFDFNQALSFLNAMLYSTDPKQQHMALQCMDQFDFSLIRDRLTEYLCRCTTENLAEAGLCHFAANPSSENVYALYKIEQAHEGKIAEQAKTLRENSPEPAEEVPEVVAEGPAAIAAQNNDETQKVDENAETALKSRFLEEQRKKRSKKPAYAYRAPELTRSSKEQIAAIYYLFKDKLMAKYKWITLFLLLILAFIGWDFFIPKTSISQKKINGALKAAQYVREGTVQKIEGSNVIFVTTKDEKFVLAPLREGYRLPKEGTLLRVSLVPFRKYPDGSMVARIRSMRQISKYSEEFGSSKK
ncbi:MAG: HEAT repeat domain-containing protein [Candidatus Riflebacteria bacterium]|nr:HEAT repeat domain-containing protein [Candidatus Riflebacteria bacterium]